MGKTRLIALSSLMVLSCFSGISRRGLVSAQSRNLQNATDFLNDKLGSLDPLYMTFYWTNSITGRQGKNQTIYQIAEFHADPNTCHITYGLANPNGDRDDLSFDLKDVESVRESSASQYMKELHTKRGHPEMDNVTDPPAFVVVVNIANASAKREFWLMDEELAIRAASIMSNAVERCGGTVNDQTVPSVNNGPTSTASNSQTAGASGSATPHVGAVSASRFTNGIPQCTTTQYDGQNGALWIVNKCNIAVIVFWTSDSGNSWGEVRLRAGGRDTAGQSGIGYSRKDGRVYLYTCPQSSVPVLPNGDGMWSRTYNGPYTCALQ